MLTQDFLQLYNDELRYFHQAGQQFAEDHPQVAQHLGMLHEHGGDPFVERLLEGAAFLSARIQEKLAHEQPEFALQMLTRLAPLWYTPTPSIATIAIEPDLALPQWHSQVTLPKGSKVQLCDPSLDNKPAVFVTGQQVKIQPVLIEQAECTLRLAADFPSVLIPTLSAGAAYLRLRLSTQGVLPLNVLDLEPLNITLTQDSVTANRLLTTVFNHCQGIVLWAKTTGQPVVHHLSAECVKFSQVADEQALLPVAIGELPGSRLLREYFSAPSRFFTFQLSGINDFLRDCQGGHEFEIVLVLNRAPQALLGRVSTRDFRLFATPIINLYPRKCHPVPLSHQQSEHPLIVDRQHASLYALHSVLQVRGMTADGSPAHFSALHADTLYATQQPQAGYALRRRRACHNHHHHNPHLPHDDVFISLSAGQSGIDIDSIDALMIDALVCDRHLVPGRLQNPQFQLEVALPVQNVEMLRAPSQPKAAPEMAQVWQAVQMLAVNPLHHALPEVADCAGLLRDWLSLFCHPQDSGQLKRIASVHQAQVRHCFERYQGGGPIAWVRGAEVVVNLAENHHADQGAFLFGKVLHHALTQYCELNQTLRMQLRLDGEPYAQWGPCNDC